MRDEGKSSRHSFKRATPNFRKTIARNDTQVSPCSLVRERGPGTSPFHHEDNGRPQSRRLDSRDGSDVAYEPTVKIGPRHRALMVGGGTRTSAGESTHWSAAIQDEQWWSRRLQVRVPVPVLADGFEMRYEYEGYRYAYRY